MTISKRDFLSMGGALGAGLALPAWAQAKPLFDTINMFVPAAPGGGWDGTARSIERAAKASGLVGNFQFENVGGAGGMIGLPRFVNQRKGQGNSLMVGGSVMVGAGITNKSPVTMRNVVPVARLTEESSVIVVPAGGKIKTWKELGRNPREAAYVAFAGGGPANAAILGNQVTAGVSGYSEFEDQIKAGRMIPLAVSGNIRIPGVNVPTMRELGLNVAVANWRGVFAAPGVTAAQRDKLVELMSKLNQSTAWQQELVTRKWTGVYLAELPFEREINKDMADTEGVLKDLGLA